MPDRTPKPKVARRPSPSPGGARPRVTIAELEDELEIAYRNLESVQVDRSRLRAWNADARRLMSLLALGLFCYAIVLALRAQEGR